MSEKDEEIAMMRGEYKAAMQEIARLEAEVKEANLVVVKMDELCSEAAEHFRQQENILKTSLSASEAREKGLREVLREIVRISDRKHNAWDKAKELLGDPK